jgi:hypothetical protein
MALSFVPMLRFYGLNLPWALALPLIATVYTFWTLLSALAHARGIGGMWKGRPAPMREAAS